MGDLNWAKTSPASSLVRSEAFWCTVGTRSSAQEGSVTRWGEGRRVDSPTCAPRPGRTKRIGRDSRSIRWGPFQSPHRTHGRRHLCGWKWQLTAVAKECSIPMSFRRPAGSSHPRPASYDTRITPCFLFSRSYMIYFSAISFTASFFSSRLVRLFLEEYEGWSTFRVGRVGMRSFGRAGRNAWAMCREQRISLRRDYSLSRLCQMRR